MPTHKPYVHTEDGSSCSQNCPNLGATQTFFHRGIDEQAVVLPDDGIAVSARKRGAVRPGKDTEGRRDEQVGSRRFLGQ